MHKISSAKKPSLILSVLRVLWFLGLLVFVRRLLPAGMAIAASFHLEPPEEWLHVQKEEKGGQSITLDCPSSTGIGMCVLRRILGVGGPGLWQLGIDYLIDYNLYQ